MMIRLLGGMMVLVSAAACAGNQAGPATGPEIGGSANWTLVTVANTTPMSLRVFAVTHGSETPIGRVRPMQETRLRIPMPPSGDIRLVARPSVDLTGQSAHYSTPISLMEDQEVRWELRASPGVSDVPRMSTISIIPSRS
jgi:hypothetical protein